MTEIERERERQTPSVLNALFCNGTARVQRIRLEIHKPEIIDVRHPNFLLSPYPQTSLLCCSAAEVCMVKVCGFSRTVIKIDRVDSVGWARHWLPNLFICLWQVFPFGRISWMSLHNLAHFRSTTLINHDNKVNLLIAHWMDPCCHISLHAFPLVCCHPQRSILPGIMVFTFCANWTFPCVDCSSQFPFSHPQLILIAHLDHPERAPLHPQPLKLLVVAPESFLAMFPDLWSNQYVCERMLLCTVLYVLSAPVHTFPLHDSFDNGDSFVAKFLDSL